MLVLSFAALIFACFMPAKKSGKQKNMSKKTVMQKSPS